MCPIQDIKENIVSKGGWNDPAAKQIVHSVPFVFLKMYFQFLNMRPHASPFFPYSALSDCPSLEGRRPEGRDWEGAGEVQRGEQCMPSETGPVLQPSKQGSRDCPLAGVTPLVLRLSCQRAAQGFSVFRGRFWESPLEILMWN